MRKEKIAREKREERKEGLGQGRKPSQVTGSEYERFY